jgi:ABC-type branched-subunit amino acid transport system substrate-binding protein
MVILLLLCPAPTADCCRLLHVLQVPSDTFQGSAAADLMVNSGHQNIALVYEDTPYGYGLGFAFIAAFTSREWQC